LLKFISYPLCGIVAQVLAEGALTVMDLEEAVHLYVEGEDTHL
jgi:hypothetical protein